MQLTQICKPR